MLEISTRKRKGAPRNGCGATKYIALLWLFLTIRPAFSQTVRIPDNLWRLAAQEDTDHDQKITIHDHLTPFAIRDTKGAQVRVVTNEYQLSVLLQDLKHADDQHTPEISLADLRLDENIVDRTHRLIKNVYWDALTRRVDAAHIDQVVQDPKVVSKADYIYMPGTDQTAVNYFEAVERTAAAQNRSPALKVVLLPAPDKITGAFVRNLDGEHGLLSLALETNADGKISGVPYVVPGGRFNELYCWDSYFITLGLLQDGRTNLARGMADNLLYEVRYYGKVPNANRTYYLTRSQPPFLTSIIRAVYESGAADKAWLAAALKTAMAEYQNVWLGPDRLVKIGPYELSRYHGSGSGPCPEVQPGGYDEQIQPWLAQVNKSASTLQRFNASTSLPVTPFRFLNEYLYCGQFADLKADGMTLNQFFINDRAVRESGHDTTHRFDDRTADFVSVDLNSLLYKYETDFADLIETQFGGRLPGVGGEKATAKFWRQRAAKRKAAMMALMWDEKRGYFFDYDFVNHKRSAYISATGLWPLWAKMLDTNNPAEMESAKQVAAFACEKLEHFAGLSATAKESVESARRHDPRQWDYPYGWAPHQMLAWRAFKNYGLDADASRLAYRWLYCIAKNAHDYNGVIPEKYNVVTGSHEVFVEYGNVGTKFSYIAPEGFGWMNASFEVGMKYLSPAQLADLRALKPPSAK
jgi:alpha,alpha-trehalase